MDLVADVLVVVAVKVLLVYLVVDSAEVCFITDIHIRDLPLVEHLAQHIPVKRLPVVAVMTEDKELYRVFIILCKKIANLFKRTCRRGHVVEAALVAVGSDLAYLDIQEYIIETAVEQDNVVILVHCEHALENACA